MKRMNQLLLAAFFAGLGILCLMNVFLVGMQFLEGGREYRISLNRIQRQIEEFEGETGRAAKNIKTADIRKRE